MCTCPERAPWLASYLAELTTFPNGKHDDQVDSTAQMLDWFKQAGRQPQDGIWHYTKMLAEKQRNTPPKPVPLSVQLGLRRW